jgi:hypothetical protein
MPELYASSGGELRPNVLPTQMTLHAVTSDRTAGGVCGGRLVNNAEPLILGAEQRAEQLPGFRD